MDAYQRRISAKIFLDINYSLLGKYCKDRVHCFCDAYIGPIRNFYIRLHSRGLSLTRCLSSIQSLAKRGHVQLTDCQQPKLVPAYCILPAPVSTQLSSVPTYHCDMLQLLLVADQRPRTLRREAPSTESAHTGAGTSRWLYHISGWVLSNSLRASLAVGTPRYDGPNLPDCIKAALMSAIPVRSFPSYYYVAPIHPRCFSGCWIAQWLSESL
jgi:hypothetical protein